jgi:hypothetical protein
MGALTEVATWTNHCNRLNTLEEQKLYDHLLYWVQVESPSQLIERFRTLFIDGGGYPDHEILVALDKITDSKFADQEFKFILNRCCHILINRWQMQPQLQTAIPELITLFENPPVGLVRSRGARRLRELVQVFIQTEQYLTLRRLAQVISQAVETNYNYENRVLGTLIQRYPYLYQHCLLSEDSTYEHQQTVRHIQVKMQRQFELDLSQYATYQVRRCLQTARGANLTPACTTTSPSVERILQPVKNPTLLSDRDLDTALKQFVGKVEGNHTYRDLAQRFLAHSSQNQSYATFKDDLYEYLTSSIDLGRGKCQFHNQLYTQLKNTLPQSDSQKISDFLLVRTCSQLLNFLVVESSQQPHHFIFVDLTTNIGPTLTTGLLLKIVLLCRKVKPYLEKRFSILFSHYESYTREGIQWLVESLENLNVALSTHFGAVDLSYISYMV